MYPANPEKGHPHVTSANQPYPEHPDSAESRSTAKWGTRECDAADTNRSADAVSNRDSLGRQSSAESHGETFSIASSALLYTIPEVMKLLRLGKTQIFDELRRGRIRSVKVGRARRVPAFCLDEFVALLMHEAEEAA
jgi:excisionase family DNA binding protein